MGVHQQQKQKTPIIMQQPTVLQPGRPFRLSFLPSFFPVFFAITPSCLFIFLCSFSMWDKRHSHIYFGFIAMNSHFTQRHRSAKHQLPLEKGLLRHGLRAPWSPTPRLLQQPTVRRRRTRPPRPNHQPRPSLRNRLQGPRVCPQLDRAQEARPQGRRRPLDRQG